MLVLNKIAMEPRPLLYILCIRRLFRAVGVQGRLLPFEGLGFFGDGISRVCVLESVRVCVWVWVCVCVRGVCVCVWVVVCVCVCVSVSVRIAAKLQSRMFTSEHSETFPKIVIQILFVRLSYGVRDLSKYFSISEASASCLFCS